MIWSPKLVTPPASMPVTLDDARKQLSLPPDPVTGTHPRDGQITLLIQTAAAHIEPPNGFVGRSLITQTWRISADREPEGVIEIPFPPMQSVESIKYIDAAGDEQTIDVADYSVDTDSTPGRIKPKTRWPKTGDHLSAFTIQFIAGYGNDPEDVPPPIRQAIMMMIRRSYYNDEDGVLESTAKEVERESWGLLGNYRMWRP